MQYYHEDDSVRGKVVTAIPSVEVHGNKLCGCLTVELKEPLLDDEQTVLCNYISGQYSDGWGEGFEQREIDVGDGKLYVHFWQDHDFELKRDVPDMTEFNKLLNRPKKPKMQLIGQDGNIFAIMGRASRLLKSSGQGDKAKEMRDRVMSCDSYQKALNIISEYVETELSPTPTPKRDRGDKEKQNTDPILSEGESVRTKVRDNIELDLLCHNQPESAPVMQEIYELVVETIQLRSSVLRLGNNLFPMALVRERLLQLTSEHIRFVLDGLRNLRTDVKNLKKYLLTMLFNAPVTLNGRTMLDVRKSVNSGFRPMLA